MMGRQFRGALAHYRGGATHEDHAKSKEGRYHILEELPYMETP